jgi:hypothetical protein
MNKQTPTTTTNQPTPTLEEVVTKLNGGDQPATMYRAANIMSEILGVRVREQMLYNYRTKKLIRTNTNGRVEIPTLVAFIQKRVDKTTNQQ